MKKKYNYTELSDKTCQEKVGVKKGRTLRCGKRLKRRLVESKASHNITRCYQHRTRNKQS